MSKGIVSYPQHMRQMVVDRRMRQYDPKGHNGLGTLAAKAAYDKRFAAPATKPAKAKNK